MLVKLNYFNYKMNNLPHGLIYIYIYKCLIIGNSKVLSVVFSSIVNG